MRQNPRPDVDYMNIPMIRQGAAAMNVKQREQLDRSRPVDVEESRVTVKMRDDFESEIKIHRPAGEAKDKGKGLPLVVLLFGGGFVVSILYQLRMVLSAALY